MKVGVPVLQERRNRSILLEMGKGKIKREELNRAGLRAGNRKLCKGKTDVSSFLREPY